MRLIGPLIWLVYYRGSLGDHQHAAGHSSCYLFGGSLGQLGLRFVGPVWPV